jgi:hypothetical protein
LEQYLQEPKASSPSTATAERPLPDGTPADVVIKAEAPEPELDPTLGIALTPPDGGQAKHRLVAIGDSLTHGFQSLAIFNTRLSYPALIARELGWFDQYRYPTYDGYGGLPFNLELCLRQLERRFGSLNFIERVAAFAWLPFWAHRGEHWWTTEADKKWAPPAGLMHDLAVFGYKLADATTRTAGMVRKAVVPPTHEWRRLMANNTMDRAARRVVANAGDDMTLVDIARAHGEDGGIETLIVALGANNALGVVIHLDYKTWATADSTAEDLQRASIWSPTLFGEDWDRLISAVESIKAAHVIIASVPHVTIAPLCAGVGQRLRADSRYYQYYTHAWLRDQFKQTPRNTLRYLTGAQARAVDSAIDQYNEIIKKTVKDQRRAGRDWYFFDLCGLLDRLAYRRYLNPDSGGTDAARPSWWKKIGPYPLPAPLESLRPPPDTRFFTSQGKKRIEGGLIALDGVHPTTIGYGIMAQEFIRIMERAEVKFYDQEHPAVVRPGPINIDFAELLAVDSLMAAPPHTLAHDLRVIGLINKSVDIVLTLLDRQPE